MLQADTSQVSENTASTDEAGDSDSESETPAAQYDNHDSERPYYGSADR